MSYQALEEHFILGDHFIERVFLLDALQGLRGECLRQILGRGHLVDGLSERFRVVRRYQDSGSAFQDLFRAAASGGNHRDAAGHGLDAGDREALSP